MLQKIKSRLSLVVPAVAGVVASAGSALAADLIDYSATATAMSTSLGTAITAAVGVGSAVLIARMGWKFFKSFTK